MMNNDRHVVVVGSGHSGASSALTLLEQGIPVTMLDSALDRPQGGLLVRMMGMNIYRKKPEIKENRRTGPDGTEIISHESFVIGGLSHNWAGAVPRFAPGDFN